MPDLAVLQKNLGIFFKNLSLLEQALVHSSYINENPGIFPISNENLEFLGDAVLGLVIAEKLHKDLPCSNEGELTKLRAAVVRQTTLARVAKTIRLGDYLYLGKGEAASDGQNKPANLAGAMEAIIAAIFLDQNWVTTRDSILRLFSEEINKAINQVTGIDYKSRLQELLQARQQITPTYRLMEAVGPAHDRKFTIEVMAGETILGKGSGKSKKIAESEAACSALKRLTTIFTQ